VRQHVIPAKRLFAQAKHQIPKLLELFLGEFILLGMILAFSRVYASGSIVIIR
jgi:hypothetical protein